MIRKKEQTVTLVDMIVVALTNVSDNGIPDDVIETLGKAGENVLQGYHSNSDNYIGSETVGRIKYNFRFKCPKDPISIPEEDLPMFDWMLKDIMHNACKFASRASKQLRYVPEIDVLVKKDQTSYIISVTNDTVEPYERIRELEENLRGLRTAIEDGASPGDRNLTERLINWTRVASESGEFGKMGLLSVCIGLRTKYDGNVSVCGIKINGHNRFSMSISIPYSSLHPTGTQWDVYDPRASPAPSPGQVTQRVRMQRYSSTPAPLPGKPISR